jgi:hypothetical protein
MISAEAILSLRSYQITTKYIKIRNTGKKNFIFVNILICVSFPPIFYCRRMANLVRRNVTLPSLSVRIHQLTNILKLTNRRERFINLLVENTATKSPVMVSSSCTWLNTFRGHYFYLKRVFIWLKIVVFLSLIESTLQINCKVIMCPIY